MLEELRVSLFAQTLGTQAPVSENRILAALSPAASLDSLPPPHAGRGRVVTHLWTTSECYVALQNTPKLRLRGVRSAESRNRDRRPPVRRRLVGGTLRRYRENVGYSLEDAGPASSNAIGRR